MGDKGDQSDGGLRKKEVNISTRQKFQAGKGFCENSFVPRETLSPLMQATMKAAELATNWEKNQMLQRKMQVLDLFRVQVN